MSRDMLFSVYGLQIAQYYSRMEISIISSSRA